MPRDIDHLVETHRLAQQRRAAGLPVWDRKINLGDVFHNDSLTFEQIRDVAVQRIRRSGWLTDDDYTLTGLVDELAETADADEFDCVWDEIYDHADIDRVWIATW